MSTSLGLLDEPAATPPEPAPEDIIALQQEHQDIIKEQASGAWDPPEGADPAALAAHAEKVQSRIRRAIEVIAILRRTNTGPAKAGGSRAKRGKAQVDIAAIKEDLLS